MGRTTNTATYRTNQTSLILFNHLQKEHNKKRKDRELDNEFSISNY